MFINICKVGAVEDTLVKYYIDLIDRNLKASDNYVPPTNNNMYEPDDSVIEGKYQYRYYNKVLGIHIRES